MRAASDVRLLFYVPSVTGPVGGVNVTLDMIAILRRAGLDAQPLYPRPEPAYRQLHRDLPGGQYDSRLISAQLGTGRVGRAARIALPLRALAERAFVTRAPADGATPLALRNSDIVVVPDWAFDHVTDFYPRNPQVLLVQGMQPLCNGFGARAEAGTSRLVATLATSRACADLAGLLPVPAPQEITLAVRTPATPPRAPKERRIAYMPRKMPHLARAAALALSGAKDLDGVALTAIDNVPVAEVDRVLSSSLVFLSLVSLEGFGLPAAEALRSECIVVGFDGVGGREFMTPETAVTVPAGDVHALIQAVRAVLREYDADPERLDAMRARGAALIADRYTEPAFRSSVCAAFEEVVRRALARTG